MLAGIRRWEERRSEPELCGEALKARVSAEIAPFLGTHATRQLLLPVSSSGENLLSTLEPLLANFLGDEAASELVSHVIDAAIVRT